MSYLSELQESTLVDSSTTSGTDINNRDTFNRDIESYIEPRDPSITNFWMRPRPTHGTNLCPLFDNFAATPDEIQHLKVYLRIKPIPETKQTALYEIQDKSLITSSQNISKLFNFSHIFSPSNTQTQVFNTMIKDNLFKFVAMHDFTLLTYGSSGSGKTYSLMGTESQPGIIPRCLEFLFARVQPDTHPRYKPKDGNNLGELAPGIRDKEIQVIESIVKCCSTVQQSAGLDNYRRMSRCLSRESRHWMEPRHPVNRYEVWVSFVEIYNECVHDLLRADVVGRIHDPPKLKIVQSTTHQPYIKGVRWVCARSGVEAYAALAYGKRRLRYAHTNMNSHSSRSHCLFTLKLITYKSDGSCTNMSTLRLCDLAGLERAKKTLNEGARLAESRNINMSLHVLEKCLEAKRSKQAGVKALPPYRESKLTQLLQNALLGREAITMLVNINPEANFFDETQRVLKFSALAAQILVDTEDKTNPILLESNLTESKTMHQSSVSSQLELSADQSLYRENMDLRNQLERMEESYERRLMQREREIRDEVSEQFIQIKQKSDRNNQARIEDEMETMATRHQWEMDSVTEYYKNMVDTLKLELEGLKDKQSMSCDISSTNRTLVEEGLREELAFYREKLANSKMSSCPLIDDTTLEELNEAKKQIEYLEGKIGTVTKYYESIVATLKLELEGYKDKQKGSCNISSADKNPAEGGLCLCCAKDGTTSDELNEIEEDVDILEEQLEYEQEDTTELNTQIVKLTNGNHASETEKNIFTEECLPTESISSSMILKKDDQSNMTDLSLGDKETKLDDLEILENNIFSECADNEELTKVDNLAHSNWIVKCEIIPDIDKYLTKENFGSSINVTPEMNLSTIVKEGLSEGSCMVEKNIEDFNSTTRMSLSPIEDDTQSQDQHQVEQHTECLEIELESNNECLPAKSDSLLIQSNKDEEILSIMTAGLNFNDNEETKINDTKTLEVVSISESTNNDESIKVDNKFVHSDCIVKCEIMPDIDKYLNKENIANTINVTPQKNSSDIVEERLLQGFYTVKKENGADLNCNGAKSSRRKLFARRALDEVAAETRATRSNKCLNFLADSPDCIVPPPISKPYVVEKPKSTRKKK